MCVCVCVSVCVCVCCVCMCVCLCVCVCACMCVCVHVCVRERDRERDWISLLLPNNNKNISSSHDNCRYSLTSRLGIGAESSLGCSYCSLFLRCTSAQVMFNWYHMHPAWTSTWLGEPLRFVRLWPDLYVELYSIHIIMCIIVACLHCMVVNKVIIH